MLEVQGLEPVNSVSWSGNLIASGSDSRIIRIWNVQTGAKFLDLEIKEDNKEDNENMVSCVARSPTGDRLVSSSKNLNLNVSR